MFVYCPRELLQLVWRLFTWDANGILQPERKNMVKKVTHLSGTSGNKQGHSAKKKGRPPKSSAVNKRNTTIDEPPVNERNTTIEEPQKKRGRGRPPKSTPGGNSDGSGKPSGKRPGRPRKKVPVQHTTITVKRKRGRPRKSTPETTGQSLPKRGRGRPRKDRPALGASTVQSTNLPRRRPGRPRKDVSAEPQQVSVNTPGTNTANSPTNNPTPYTHICM